MAVSGPGLIIRELIVRAVSHVDEVASGGSVADIGSTSKLIYKSSMVGTDSSTLDFSEPFVSYRRS
ncbi:MULTISPECIES: hypothetical protein [Candidatus Ichthyocystis]|uniref:hypothetical protein n=1 Tax=Candidatus Ichthyocystis TaxID=2929841 RepID=UPI000B8A25EF|nr:MULTISPECIES: hypothetical protein [Ichthyocystis]